MNYDDELMEEQNFKASGIEDDGFNEDTDEPIEEVKDPGFEDDDPDNRYH